MWSFIADLLRSLPDGDFVVSIRKSSEYRTVEQNRLYWRWLECIHNELGEDVNELHEFFKDKFLTRNAFKQDGEEVVCRWSTSKIDRTFWFPHYLRQVQSFAAIEWGIFLPEPKDMEYEQFIDAFFYIY